MGEFCSTVQRLLPRRQGRSSRVGCWLWSPVDLKQRRNRGRKRGYAHDHHVIAPKGYLPIRVLQEEEAMVVFVKAEKLNNPLFAELLRSSAEEYSYGYTGALRLSCDAITLQKALLNATITRATTESKTKY